MEQNEEFLSLFRAIDYLKLKYDQPSELAHVIGSETKSDWLSSPRERKMDNQNSSVFHWDASVVPQSSSLQRESQEDDLQSEASFQMVDWIRQKFEDFFHGPCPSTHPIAGYEPDLESPCRHDLDGETMNPYTSLIDSGGPISTRVRTRSVTRLIDSILPVPTPASHDEQIQRLVLKGLLYEEILDT